MAYFFLQFVFNVTFKERHLNLLQNTSITGNLKWGDRLPVQIVVSFLPVCWSLHCSCLLIFQLNTIEIQHELVWLQEITFCQVVLTKILKETQNFSTNLEILRSFQTLSFSLSPGYLNFCFCQSAGLIVHPQFLQRKQPLKENYNYKSDQNISLCICNQREAYHWI